MLLPQANLTFTDIHASKINKSYAQMELSLYYFQTSNCEVATCRRWRIKLNGGVRIPISGTYCPSSLLCGLLLRLRK